MRIILLRENKMRRNQEHFWVVGLDNKNQILFVELVALGKVNCVSVDPPEVFRFAIVGLAVNIILVHNHPSGNLKLSQADIDLTDRMFKTGQLMNIQIIDHLVITEKSYTSMADEGIVEKIKSSGLFEIVDRQKHSFNSWKQEMIQKEKAVDIAQKLKKDNINADLIKKYTGLTKWDIRKIKNS